MKTIEENFIDWEASAFGFGYGTGEPVILPLLKQFLEHCRPSTYDYKDLTAVLGEAPTWFLINTLCQQGILEYGVSPRFGWLTTEGLALKRFVESKTADELVSLACECDADYVSCYPDACNCGENGYEPNRKCPNPFWRWYKPEDGADHG